MMLNQIAKKSLVIASGNENEIFNTVHELKLENGPAIKFKVKDLLPLDKAEKTVAKELIDELLSKCTNINKDIVIPELPVYKNEDELCVYLLDSGNYLSLISFGEYQYGLYKIYIEGVFEKVANLSL